MGFPAGVDTVLLTLQVGLADGAAQRETVTLTPTPPEVVSTAHNFIMDNSPIVITPDRGAGTASVRLLPTDAAGFVPSGWTYEVRRGDRAPYFISLPAATPTVDLADLTPVSADPGTYELLLPAADLGESAYLDVGQTADTVAAGDDPRFSTGGPPSGAAGGDLAGTYPGPTLAPTANVTAVVKQQLGTNNTPALLGYTAWTSSVRDYSADQLAINGTIYLAAIDLYVAANLTSIIWHVGAVGATPTAGANWVGLYDSTGTRRAAVGVDGDITSTGRKSAAISYAAAPGRYYAAFLFNAATAPQMPRLAGGNARATFINGALTGANLLYATNGTGTTLPATVTLASSIAGIGFFAALI